VATLDAAAIAEAQLPVPPGAYVLLTVADTGCGMDEATRARIFEPFFTTKEKGKGTGLGLATVYGIVTQSGGGVAVQSEVGRGTTFRIYLPRAADAPAAAPRAAERPVRLTGTELILVVEDEDAVLKLVRRILVGAGYRVLLAPNAGEALMLCEEHRAEVKLLLADVVMPILSGPELAARLSTLVPGLRVLYMSGYSDETLTNRGLLRGPVPFIGKPFTQDALLRKVRAVLDAPEA
jgi:CheY-like chemotaxis protein